MSTMRSQSGTFYKIIVTLFILGVNHLSLSTGAQSRRGGCSEDAASKQLPLVPSEPSKDEPIASASTLNAAMASVVFMQEGAVNGTELNNNSSAPTGSLNSLNTEPEGGKLLSAVAPQEPKETLLTAAQSYFIEPEQSTTTTQRPTFKRRKTAKPISSLTENKKAPVIEENSYNEIPQGNPVRINRFRNNANTSFGKSRPSNAKLGRIRSRPNRPQPQTGSDSTAEAKVNEVISSTERDAPRPSFNRRRPTQRPSSDNGEDSAPEVPTARKFPVRKPRPSHNEGNRKNNDHNNNGGFSNDNQGSENTSQRPRSFRRMRPSNSSLTGSKPELSSGGALDSGFQQQRRIRPIRPLVHSRLTNPNLSPATTITTTSTTTEAAPVSVNNPYEKSPLEDILGLSEFYLSNSDRPTTTSFQGLSPFPFQEMPDHLNNIINGIGPIPIAPGSNKASENENIPISPVATLRPSLRGGSGTGNENIPVSPAAPLRPSLRGGSGAQNDNIPISPAAPLRPLLRTGSGTGGRQGFVLRPRSSTPSPIDGDNEILSRPQQRRRKRPQTTTESSALEDISPINVQSNQRHVGGIVRSRPRGNENKGSTSIRGGIPDSGVPRNQEKPAPPAVRTRIVIPNIIENEAVPVRGNDNAPIRGSSRLNNNPPRNSANIDYQRENSMPTRGGIIIQDLRGNEEVSVRGSRINSGLQRIPISPALPLRGNANIPSSPGNDNAPNRGSRVNNGPQRVPINSSFLHGGVIIPDLTGHGDVPIQGNNRHIQSQRNPLNTPAFHGGVVFPNLDEDDSPPPLRRIPSIVVQDKPRIPLLPTNLPFPPLPLLSNSGLPQSYQIRDEPMLQPVIPIPKFKRMPETVKLPTVVQQVIPSTPRPVPARVPASASLSASNIPSSPSGLGAVHIQQSLNAALSPSNFQSPGLFQVPPRDNLGFYPGLDNVLGINPNVKTAQRKSGKAGTNQFSSRTTIVPEEVEISFSPSASNENQAVVVSDNSIPQLANTGEVVQETSQPDLTTVTTTTITTATPKKLTPLERLHQNRQAAARKFLTPKKPTEKTTLPPTPVKKNQRKSVFPPRSLRSRGKSVQPETADSPEVSNAAKEENPGGNASDINNESISSAELDTVSNAVPISTDPVEVEQETSSRKPSILENAKRRRLPLPAKSAASPVQQSQPQQQKVRSAAASPTLQHVENVDTSIPTCEGGERYNKFLKRCVATYKPRVQG